MFRTYYKLAKPGIVYGNLLTTAAGFLLADKNTGLDGLAAILGGTALVIASACVCNNYIDRGIDLQMIRTKNRALVTGDIPVHGAMIYATILGVAGFAVLLLWANLLSFAIGLAAFLTYTILYGLAKRHSVHGTLVGSLAGAAPPVAGYTAATNRLDGAALLLFLCLIFWQMAHFYAIAIYRAKDYRAAKIPVLPVVQGLTAAKKQIIVYAVLFLAAALQFTTFDYTGYIYLGFMALLGVLWLSRVLDGLNAKTKAEDETWARQVFLTSLIVILGFSAALALGGRLP